MELGILETKEPSNGTNPHQSDSAPSDRLPSVETLSGDKNPTATDGGERSCPCCGTDDVLDAAKAKSAYIDAVENPNPRAVLAYELAEHSCQNPDCAALWGPKYDEAIPMQEVVDA